jgi:hypothetical protein
VDAGVNKVSNQQLTSNLRSSPMLFSNLRADGQSRWDLSLFKNFKVTEKLTTQFRAECIRAWNHPEPPGPQHVADEFHLRPDHGPGCHPVVGSVA